ncbi:hypothetical protein V7S43_003898 [Phytophthora oleae]|uniref:Uncharacterized protein n=1 Tax=Phytophthora oleae TaxID=2107226 RepID=A0ABD3FUV7_9STRA
MIRVFKSVKALDKRAFVESYMGVKMENVRMDEAVNTRVNDPRRIAFIVDVPVRATSRIRLLYTKERRFLRLAKIIEGWDAVVLEMTSLCTIFAVFDTQEEASFQEGTAILGVARLLVAVLKVLLEWLGEGILPRSAYDNL